MPSRLKIVAYLEERFPLKAAETWDNVGLLVETDTDLEANLFLTNDLTETVLEEAISKKCNFILTYHPNPFRGMKRITMKDSTQRIIIKCIQNDIWVYSPHTACDNSKEGVNDWLAMYPTTIECVDENGRGRIVRLDEPKLLKTVISEYKAHLGVDSIRFAPASALLLTHRNSVSCAAVIENTLIKTIAVQAGSGASVLLGVEADLFVTGEMSHHECMSANSNGTSVVLVEHSNSERGFLSILGEQIHSSLGVKCILSAVDSDPLVNI